MKKAIKRGEVLIDGHPGESGWFVKPGQKIQLIDREENGPKPYEYSIETVYLDEHIVVINKPAGIVVNGNQFRTIENALIYNIPPGSSPGSLKWPRPAHRLDAPTSGLLLVARTSNSLIHLNRQFQEGTIEKHYRAVVSGMPQKSGTWYTPIDERNAITRYQRLRVAGSLKTGHTTLLELEPVTGRTHQLRIHCSGAGHPIVGDKIYTPHESPVVRHKGLFLCAVRLKFRHPVYNNWMEPHIDMPPKFSAFLEREQHRWEKYRSA